VSCGSGLRRVPIEISHPARLGLVGDRSPTTTASQPSSLSLISPSVSPSYVRAVVLVVAALIPTTMLSRDDVAVRLATRTTLV
jgi:hypothetical protein